MNARIRKAIATKDGGFTLIELLVVMIIIGILAAIAIPVFSSQQNRAKDTALRADLSTIGKEVTSDFVDDGKTNLSFAGASATEVTGVVVGGTTIPFTGVVQGVAVRVGGSSDFCIQATQKETTSKIHYNIDGTTASGIHDGDCSGTTTPLTNTPVEFP